MKKNKYFFYIVVSALSCFKTIEAAGQTLIFEEQFDSQIPNDFILYNDDYTPHADVSEYHNAWIFKTDPQNLLNGVASSTSYFVTPKVTNRWMITPEISLGNNENVISWTAKSHDASFAESYIVLLSETGSNKENFTDTLMVVQNENVDWTLRAVDLSKLGYDGKTIRVAFILATIDGFKFYLDSLKITSDNPPNSVPDPQPVLPIPPPSNLGIKQTNWMNSIEVYPNPTSHTIIIKSEVAVENINIRDLSCRLILSTDKQKIDVSNIPKGIYFIEVKSKYGIATQRLIKN